MKMKAKSERERLAKESHQPQTVAEMQEALKMTVGEVKIEVSRARDGSFSPRDVKKRQKDVSAIEDKVLSMYAKGLSQQVMKNKLCKWKYRIRLAV